jgi:hypothetical protein
MVNEHIVAVSEVTGQTKHVGASSGFNMAIWRTAGNKLCQLTVILRQEFCTRICTFYVAAECGSSNVCTRALDVLLGSKLRAVGTSRV